MSRYSTDLLVWGTIAHLVADWMFQNDWMAVGKVRWASPQSFSHMAAHLGALAFVFPWYAAIVLALVHQWIDTRTPLEWWRRMLGQAKPDNPLAVHVKIWQDQAAHVICIAAAAMATSW